MPVPPLHSRPAWALLKKHHQKIKRVQLRQLFAKDRERGERLSVEAAGLYLDYSKNRITDETLGLLLQLAQESGLREHIDAMKRLFDPQIYSWKDRLALAARFLFGIT